MRRKMNPRNAKRMMQKMGMNMGEMPDVEEVIFKTSDKEIVVDCPDLRSSEKKKKGRSWMCSHGECSFGMNSMHNVKAYTR